MNRCDSVRTDRPLTGKIMPHLPWVVLLCAGTVVWVVFFPAIMSPDSIRQYEQARTGSFTSWHPPIMSAVLALFFRFGLGIGAMMLCQCLAGVFGLRIAIEALLAFFRENAPIKAAWLATALTLGLVSPLTPTAVYFMTFWKDSWTAILLLWVAGISISLFQRCPEMSNRQFMIRLAILLFTMTAAGLPRHNTITVAPAFGAILALILGQRHVRLAWLASPLPVVCILVAGLCMEHCLHVKRMPIEKQCKAVDLLGVYVRFPELRAELPYTSSSVREGLVDQFRLGEVGTFVRGNPAVVASSYLPFGPEDNAALTKEYWQTALSHPLALGCVKAKAFLRVLNPFDDRQYYYHGGIDPNAYGLRQCDGMRSARAWYYSFHDMLRFSPTLRWLNMNGFWFAVSLFAAMGFAYIAVWRRHRRDLFTCLVVSLPLSYSLGFALATTGIDHRYLFPSTLLMQGIALAYAADRVRKCGRPPTAAAWL